MAKKLQLGRQVALPTSPDEAVLDPVPNLHADTNYVARFTAPEFTCLCPVTGQPDFAHFVIDYCPAKSLVESKSLKLFLGSFRNHAAFHEATTVMIGKRIASAIKPKYLRIAGYWFPRGGMPIDVFWQTGKLPSGVWLPDTGVAPYRGQGMTAPDLVPIPESDKSELWNDLQHYIAELAPFDRALPPQGPYEYPGFDTLWRTRTLFWAMLDGEIAGFAIVHSESGVTDMSDFYIRPAYRRHRIGRAFALSVIARFPGPWTLTQYKAKADSIAFWRSVIGERPFTEHDYTSANGNARVKQAFVS